MTTASDTELLDIEHRFICRILTQPEDWLITAQAQIDEEFFQNSKHKKVWQAITEYQREYRSVPTVAVLRRDFPKGTYKFVRVEEPIEFLLDELRDNRRSALLEQGIADAATAWEDGDYSASLAALYHTSSVINRVIPVADDMDLTKTGDERLAAYMERIGMDEDGVVGIPTGYRCLDLATGGLQPEQLITLAGFSKNGKSFVLMDMARAAHLSGHAPLFIGFEMSNREQGERVDASRAGVSLTRLRNGTLSDAEWELLKRSVADLANMHSFVLSADRGRTMTISGIAAKIEQIQPPVVYVDGVYMMEDEQGEPRMTPRALSNLTQGFKRLAQTYKIPIVISTQGLEWKADKAKGGGMSRTTVGYGSSFLTDSDGLIGVEISKDNPDIQIIKILASRTTQPQDFYVKRDWDKGSFEELDYNPFETDGSYEDDDDFASY
ncbi:DnaB-like helicase C-terminal domain-containing protein [Streptomyces sp. NPDC005551]|uniref:DnaB-like helicase C-terminal domain-containing protein n=1 Tax=Streptomyces sp. NPDC005551 TaxID=3364725 RepID=UPI0036A18039